MLKLLEQYKNKEPEIVFEWSDQETSAKGWVVINSLRGGAAGGGTRMRKGLNKEEVISLAKVMEVKFSVCGPEIGGAKSGIDFDPNDPRKDDVLKRWYKAVIPLLKNYYGTGGDLNIDEIKDVIPITQELGHWHPQQGIVNGHFKANEGDRIEILGQLRSGVSHVVENPNYTPSYSHKYAVADLITGFGVAEAAIHFYDLYKGTSIKDKKVVIQGWGNVASAAAYYLADKGAKIVGIVDTSGGLINEDGLTFDEVRSLYIDKGRGGTKLTADGLIPFSEANEKIWDVACDVFIPGAASKLLTKGQMDRMMQNGMEVISCGANVPFIDDAVFFGDTANYVDKKISLIPDFIANCGMARVFAFLMQKDIELSGEQIFEDVSNVIRKALQEVQEKNKSETDISTTALTIALEKLMN